MVFYIKIPFFATKIYKYTLLPYNINVKIVKIQKHPVKIGKIIPQKTAFLLQLNH
jgi:hypothetical protein